jgi:mono/diheme cytochrome c family protein
MAQSLEYRNGLRSSRWAALALLLVVTAGAGAQSATTPVERGRYLVESILACGNCHTAKTPTGEPIASRNLAGGLSFTLPPFDGTASNITPDRETGIGTWTDAEIKRTITTGVRPGHGRLPNTTVGVVMAVSYFKALTPTDLDAVVTYLRSVPAIRNEVPAPTYRAPQVHQPFPGAEAGFEDSKMADPVYRGRYLMTIAHCMDCHTPMDKGVSDFSRQGAGGNVFNAQLVQGEPADWPGSRSANITSHRVKGIGAWTDDEIKRAITRGISRDGRKLQPPMPFPYYARLAPADLDAIVAYLRTLPPLE